MAASNELVHIFKDLSFKIQSASLKERSCIVENITNVLDNPGITEGVIKGLCKLYQVTIHRYVDNRSQHLLKELLVSLVEKQPEWTIKHFIGILEDIAKQQQNVIVTQYISQVCLQAFHWSCLLFQHAWKGKNQDILLEGLNKLINAQSILLTKINSVENKQRCTKAFKLLAKSLSISEKTYPLYLDTLRGMDQSIYIIILASQLEKCADNHKDLQLFLQHMESLLDVVIKCLVNVKRKPVCCLVRACYPLLGEVSVEQWRATLMPALLKAMLRSPEVILECVGYILAAVPFLLCPYATDIGKSVIVQLNSKDDLTRVEAVIVCSQLAGKIENPAAIESLLKMTFDLLNGSDGKVTLHSHKMSILEGAGRLSNNRVSDINRPALAKIALQYFHKVLDSETHEKTLCFTINMIQLWSSKDTIDIVLDYFKTNTNRNTKSLTPLIRIAHLRHLSSVSILPYLSPSHTAALSPILTRIIETATSQQQPMQASGISEALSAANLLLATTVATMADSVTSDSVWGWLVDVERAHSYVGEKYLSTADDQGLEEVTSVSTSLLLHHSAKLTENQSKALIHAIINCVVLTQSNTARNKCVQILSDKLQNALIGSCPQLADRSVKLAQNILSQLLDTLENNSDYNHAHSLANTIKKLVIHKDLLIHSLLLCHHVSVHELNLNLWEKLCRHFGKDPSKVLLDHLSKINSDIIFGTDINTCKMNAFGTAMRLLPNTVMPQLMDRCRNVLTNPDVLAVTKDDYFTFCTPDGEVYDKTVLPTLHQDSDASVNVKRESKVYSYKEQLEELQLRRELEEKRRREGKIKPPTYTPKQLEAIKMQLVKEKGIRDKLTELNDAILLVTRLLSTGHRSNPCHISQQYAQLLPLLLSSLQSPLAAPHVYPLYVQLGRCAQQRCYARWYTTNAQVIGYVTVRLHEPACDLPSNWCEEKLSAAVDRVVQEVGFKHVKETKLADDMSENQPQTNNLTATAFAYFFPLLQKGLESAKATDSLHQTGLEIISQQAKLRSSTDINDLYNPIHLPIKDIFQLLITLIGTKSGRIQSAAISTLLDVANAAASRTDVAIETISADLGVLLSGLLSPSALVRDASLRALSILRDSFPEKLDVSAKNVPKHLKVGFRLYESLTRRVWVARFDPHFENQVLARELWTQANLIFSVDDCPQLMHDIEHIVEVVQVAAAQAIQATLEAHAQTDPEVINGMLKRLLNLYKERIKQIPAKMDEFGRELEPAVDRWAARKGVALALTQLAPILQLDVAGSLVEFFVSTALADREETVRKEMLTAALRVVDLHGKETVSVLLPVFENFLDKSSKSANFDAVKQAVVILMGSLARHLERDDSRIKPIVGRLISALSTPSQQVQEAVANCLPPLVPCVKEDAAGYVNKLLHQLLKSDRYGDRKGAAYGLAAMVKGMGILALKQLDIMAKLTDAIQNQKNYKHREGALFAFEMLFQTLGKLFEPYIVHVLPHLLNCFGDSNQYVRTATDDTARVVMSKLSGHGVKLVLPALLDALDDDSWRTKTGSVDMLGAMAFCAPKQLSSCLPSVVPKLIGVLSDSHPKVQIAGAEALRLIGSVIRNPEIQEIVPDLLSALQDPSARTSTSLQTLLNTKFVHFIDAPSLALIMPVVQRAFQDRSTETRKMAAQIIGNMYSLTDQKDLTPYLPTIIPGLKSSLLDPVPEVRSVSARALGAMVRGMGESSFEELLPWLMVTLTSESSSVNRSGAAQGLSEVVGGLGVEKLHKLMPEIISTAERSDIASHVKDGYIMMFIYMPAVFQDEFTPYIGQIIKPILSALADENEYVRDTALKAGQRIVNLYADSAIQLLLPELERGLFDDNWRIRYSSVQLLGDLLYRVSGVTGKMSTETASEDDNFGTEQSHKAIIIALGAERRNRVLAGLYMGRSDIALMVRQAALHVWKVVVTNTPRTLREILPTLFGLLLGCLASDSHDKRQVAARTLGDLVRKLGERVLPDIIPILEKGLQSTDADQRQGVCVGLSEIMASTSRDMVLAYAPSLVPTVRTALCDPLEEVRRAAARTFDSLHSTIGAKALDDILPYMMARLNSEQGEVAEYTLDGLQQVMAVKSRVVLPYLVPQLTSPPANTKALSILAGVAGESLNKYLPKILPALYASLATSKGAADENEQLDYCSAVVLAVVDETGVRIIIESLLDASRSPTQPQQRRAAAALLTAFCANSRAPYAAHVANLYRGLIHLCTDTDPDVLAMAAEALNAVTKQLEARALAAHVPDVRSAIRYATSSLVISSDSGQILLPGFCLPKGVAAVLPTFREALLNGDGDEKEAAAQGLSEVIRITSATALQPSVVRITGPLIRILGERFGSHVKIAVLDTLAALLAKVQATLKQFLPQLQTTFMKALADSHRGVRLHAAAALAQLLPIHQRPDPLFTELHNIIKTASESDIRETTLHALRGALGPAGEKCSEPLRRQIHSTLIELLSHAEDVTRMVAAGCLGALLKWLPTDLIEDTLVCHLLADCSDIDTRHGRCVALSIALKESPCAIWSTPYEHKVRSTLLATLSSDKIPVTLTGVRACGYLLRHLLTHPDGTLPIPADIPGPFARTFNHQSNDVKQLSAKVCLHLARQMPGGKGIASVEILKPLLPMLVNGTKEKNSYVKSNAEIALIAILHLYNTSDQVQYQYCLRILELGARDALSDVVARLQQKGSVASSVAAAFDAPQLRDDELDDTLLT